MFDFLSDIKPSKYFLLLLNFVLFPHVKFKYSQVKSYKKYEHNTNLEVNSTEIVKLRAYK